MDIKNDDLDEDEVFDESSVFAHFENFSFRDTSSNNNLLNVSALCCDEEIKGYDKLTGKTWIYPTNYPVRDYQFNIIRASLLKNTLVSLPTGLGKTFIAAVVMYNFYRWYPTGKIIFMAPTRPLVAQQIEACYNIVAMPRRDTIEMTGHMPVNIRKTHWQTKRVFFATPQVIYNDIKSGICEGNKIRCLVIDEAHRARGNYAYCQIISTLTEMGHRIYRVLALSATPGSKVEDVINVVKNLHIAHLELRNENCIDVVSYSHSRKINTVVIPLDSELTQLRQQYVEILDGYARRLKQFNILPQNIGNLTKGRIVMLYKEFQTKERGARNPQHNYIMKDFTLLIALFHGLELLVKHGSRVFLNFFDEHPEKSWIQNDDKLTALLERLRDDLGVDPLLLDRSILPDGTIPEIPKKLAFGHPKFYKLKEIMLEHFNTAKQKGQETKAIVFCEYRESVNLVHCLLLQCRPLIVPQMFVGQGASGKDGKVTTSQKQQLRVMRSFREGASNALVCTCVAEEGLDVGAVDLILCFDVSTRSPVRLVQRCGRTGRERGGQVFILVTEGKEHQTLIESMRQRDGLNQRILQSKEVENNLYKLNPRMMPRDFMPECKKMYITVDKSKSNEKEESEKSKKGQKDLRSMFGKASNVPSKERKQSDWITKTEFDHIFPKGYRDCNFFAKPVAYWSMSKESFRKNKEDDSLLNLSTWLEFQRNLQNTVNIGHSLDTKILTDVLKYDSKKFDLPSSAQNPTFSSQGSQSQNVFLSPFKTKQTKKRQKNPLTKSPCKKDGDIRTLFSSATKSTKNYTKLINDLDIHNDGKIPTRIINLLVDLHLENTKATKSCYICLYICECKVIQNTKENENISPFLLPIICQPNLPDIDLIDFLNKDSFLNFSKQFSDNEARGNFSTNIDQIKGNEIEINSVNDTRRNFDIEIDYDSLCEPNSPILEIVNKGSRLNNEDKNFDIGDIDDIFAESSSEVICEIEHNKNDSKANDALDYFQLNSIEDIFEDSDDDVPKSKSRNYSEFNDANVRKSKTVLSVNEVIPNETNKNIHMRSPSPSILSGRIKTNNVQSTSPILCSQTYNSNTIKIPFNKFQSSTPINNEKQRMDAKYTNNELLISETNSKNYESIGYDRDQKSSSDNSMLTITELVDMINKHENSPEAIASRTGDKNKNLNTTVNVKSRTPSPVIFTQRDKKINLNTRESNTQRETTAQLPKSFVISDSDSDCEYNTEEYDVDLEKTNKIENQDKQNTQFKSNFYNENDVTIIIIPDGDEEEHVRDLGTQKFTTTHKQQMNRLKSNEDDDVIVVDSPNSIDMYEVEEDGPNKNETENSSIKISNKRKFQEENSSSPFFNKKPKLNENRFKSLTLQKKVLAALTSNKFSGNSYNNNDTHANFMVLSPHLPLKLISQKENHNSELNKSRESDNQSEKLQSQLDRLQVYRRDAKCSATKNIFKDCTNTITLQPDLLRRKKIPFSDSDDDFVSDEKSRSKQKLKVNGVHNDRLTNDKTKKKKKKASKFLELEAELSEDGECNSGDELTDESVGSIIDFICDENVTHDEETDMQALYLKSIKSPVKGVFKIPQLKDKYRKSDIFSQYVMENDTYEMDSFCVDSHIGLTQANELSELELAEMLLEEKRKKKKESKNVPQTKLCDTNDESPIIIRKFKNVKRQIHSDSEDSS